MTDKKYQSLTSSATLTKLVDKMIAMGKLIGFDIESGYTGEESKGLALLTYHPNWILVGVSFTNNLQGAFYVPVAHDRGGNVDDEVVAARAIWKLVNSGLGVAHNASFELNGLSRWFRDTLWDDIVVGRQVRESNGYFDVKSDSMVEAHLLALYEPKGPGGGIGVGLKELSKHVLGHVMTEFKSLFPEDDTEMGPGTKKSKMTTIRFNTREAGSRAIIEYACEDAVSCLALHLMHAPKLTDSVIYKKEIALLRVLAEMEYEGMLLDWDYIHQKAEELLIFRDKMNEEILAELSERLQETVNINIASPKQLGDLLFNKLGLPVKMKTDSGAPSTSEKALRSIAQEDPVVKKILRYREVNKLYGSYLHKYDVELNYDGTNRARPNHRSLGALTGRLSVDHVSYQQWPKTYHFELKDGTTFDLNFRDLMIAPEGFRIIGYDWSQVELRVMAGLAQETTLIEAFRKGQDIHKTTASAMMKIPYEKVDKKLRAKGKTLNFATAYQSGAANIAEMLDSPTDPVTREDAEIMLRQYYEGYPKLRGWMDRMQSNGKESGFVMTPFGRKYTVWQFQQMSQKKNHDKANMLESEGKRLCVNAVVQGGAADLLKFSMVEVSKIIKENNLQDKIKLVCTVHDALEFYVHESISTQEVIDLFKDAVSPKIPGFPEILAEWHEGKTWGSVVELNLDDNKVITSYSLEDVDQEFSTIEEAYEYQDNPPIVDSIREEKTVENPDEEPKRVVITTTYEGLPAREQMLKFRDYLVANEGPHDVRLDTSLGENKLKWKVSLRSLDKTEISVILGGAKVEILEAEKELVFEEEPPF